MRARVSLASTVGPTISRLVYVLVFLVLTAASPLAATFIVDDTGDDPDQLPGDGACATAGGKCTLRAAIQEANAASDNPTIAFALPGSGVQSIAPASDLPVITHPSLTIDGYTQPGATPNTNPTGALNTVLLVELSGRRLVVNAPDATVRGLVINGVAGAGAIEITSGLGIMIEGDFIGTDAGGTMAVGNGDGILVSGAATTIVLTVGGSTPDTRNLISGNGTGFRVQTNSAVVSAAVTGNLIGTDKTGSVAIPNTTGIGAAGAGNDFITITVGSAIADPVEQNVISGNGGAGVSLGPRTNNCTVQGNMIGTDASGAAALPNGLAGVQVGSGPALVGGSDPGTGNVIAFNGGAGVAVVGGVGIEVLGNALFSNGGLGIDLGDDGVTPNDTGDPDAGPNGLQNFPLLSAGVFPGGTSAAGTLNSTPSALFRVEVFANDACDGSGNGEGQTFVGTQDVMTDAGGDASFTVTLAQPLPAGTILTATATGPDGSTSELSPCTAAPPTTTTAPAASTTTTTLPPGDCAALPAGPSFRSLDCRLGALIAQVSASNELGAQQTKLRQQLEKAQQGVQQAEAFCRAPKRGRTKSRLAEAIREMTRVSRTLRSHRAKKSIPPVLRDGLLEAADGLHADLRALKRGVRCPDDAPPA